MAVESSPTAGLGVRPDDIEVPTLDLRRAIAAAERGLLGDANTQVVRVGRYRVEGVVGRGAMGVVYRGHDEELSRDVAIKVLNTNDPRALVDEARALARLVHDNVVSVYDVGTVEDDAPTQVYMVMELFTGGTLRQWLHSEPSIVEIVDAFVAAGRGLQAAHEAGLVHRDFKPANVLLGSHGRVCVTDFGLAQATTIEDARTVSDPDGESGGGPIGSVVSARPGIVGTPRYMAPEQHRGHEVTHAADQYALCTALYEALAGRAPFAGSELCMLGTRKSEGDIPPIVRAGVSRRLERAVLRGLHPNPERRHASMAALLERLQPPARRWIVLLGVTTIAGAVAAIALDSPPSPPVTSGPCTSAESEWRADMRQSLTEAGSPVDEAARSRRAAVMTRLDLKLANWDDALATACEARERTAVAENTIACLDRWRTDLVALSDAITDSELSLTEQADAVVDEVVDPIACTQGDLVPAPPPAVAADVAAFRRGLVRTRALTDAGAQAAVASARALLGESTDLDYAPARAEASYELARALGRSGLAEAREAYEVAAQRLEASGLHRLAASAAVGVAVELSLLHRTADAERWARHAEAALERNPDDRIEIEYLAMRAGLHADRGDLDASLASYAKAASIATRIDPAGERYYVPFGSMGWTQIELGQADQGIANVRKALQIANRRHGRDHSAVLEYSAMLGVALLWAGRDDAAAEVLLPIVAAIEDGRLARSAIGNTSLMFTAALHARRGDFDEARRLAHRVLEFDEANHPERAGNIDGLLILAQIEGEAGNVELCLSLSRKALVEAQSLSEDPDNDAQLAMVRSELANALMLDGQYEAGLPHAKDALATLERLAGREHALTLATLDRHAYLLMATGQRQAALDAFSDLEQRGLSQPRELPYWTQFPRGAALYDLGVDVERGRALVEEAVEQLDRTVPGSAGAYYARNWAERHLTQHPPDREE